MHYVFWLWKPESQLKLPSLDGIQGGEQQSAAFNKSSLEFTIHLALRNAG